MYEQNSIYDANNYNQRGSSYVLPNNKNFYSFINKHYNKYRISKTKRTFEQICFPKQYVLQIPQKFLAEYISPNTPYDSLLVVHKIGAGKTCTAIRIAEKWKGKRKVIFLMPASLIDNLHGELLSECTGDAYIKHSDRELLKKIPPHSKDYNRIIMSSNEKINKYYEIYSYNKFVELYKQKKISLDKKVLIIDEVQNMVSEHGSYYKILYESIKTAKGGLRVVLLSATPIFDRPTEIALTLNLLNLPEELPT
jgi:superfamily II DNA or RNA helicase